MTIKGFWFLFFVCFEMDTIEEGAERWAHGQGHTSVMGKLCSSRAYQPGEYHDQPSSLFLL